MGAPKEVFFVERSDGSGFVSLTGREAFDDPLRRVHRYVLARPKREAVAWVVRIPGWYLRSMPYNGRFDVGKTLSQAMRFSTREEAERVASVAGYGARVVKLVRPVKP